LPEELIEAAKRKVDPLGGLKGMEIPSEKIEVIGFLLLFYRGEVLGTKAGVGVGSGETALTASGSAMGATKGDGIRSLRFHFGPYA
jgi:hypothetical protein